MIIVVSCPNNKNVFNFDKYYVKKNSFLLPIGNIIHKWQSSICGTFYFVEQYWNIEKNYIQTKNF